MRVIFDRSAFHGNRFRALTNSPLRVLVAKNRISVYHTQIFLDETIAAYGSKKKPNPWQDHLAFAVDICNGGIFQDKEHIWNEELGHGKGPCASYLLANNDYGDHDSLPVVLNQLRELAHTGDAELLFAETRAEREETAKKKQNQRKIALGARQEVAFALKEKRITGRLDQYLFPEFKEATYTLAGESLMSLVKGRPPDYLAYRWARDPAIYPYYSAFIEGMVYSWYLASAKHNSPVDKNDQADYEQLAYLLWADVFVSNDANFLRSAFKEIWAPRGKRLETAESFVALLDAMV